MGIDFDDDLAEMLSTDDHGATVEHASQEPTSGILNKEFFEVELSSASVGVGGSEPAVYVDSVWAAAVHEGDSLTITREGEAPEVFIVATEPEPDGTGLSRIALQTTG